MTRCGLANIVSPTRQNLRNRHFHSFILVSVFALIALEGGAATIDFNSIPDGTPVSAGNPYAGVLDIQAYGSEMAYPTGGGVEIPVSQESTIQNGVLFAGACNFFAPPPGYTLDGMGGFRTSLTATFLRAVTEVSFAFNVETYWARYSYQGIDANGVPFGGGGLLYALFPGGTWQTVNPPIPAGGYLTGFSIGDLDNVPGNASFSVDDISFTVVPDPSMFLAGDFLAGLGILGCLRWLTTRRQASQAPLFPN